MCVLLAASAAAQTPKTTDTKDAAALHFPAFEDATEKSKIQFRHSFGEQALSSIMEATGSGAVWFDYNNDGLLDLYVLSGKYIEGVTDHSHADGKDATNHLYRNNGDGTFTDVTEKAGLAQPPDKQFGPSWSVGAAWVDVDNDGLLDLFVLNYLQWDVHKEPTCSFDGKPDYCHPKLYGATPNQLFLNKGNGKFVDVSEAAGIRQHPGKAMGVGVADYDHDGRPDLFVTNDKLFNSLFHNQGNAKFEEVAFETGVALPEHGNLISGMGLDFRDVNNDGYPDIFLVALDTETFPLYQNDKKGGFVEVTGKSGMSVLSNAMSGYSANIADFDNDGWKDLFVSRGDVQSINMKDRRHVDQPNTVFRNLANGKWAALTEEAGFTALPPQRHRGAAYGDLNHDGKLDLVVTALGAPAEIWINDSPEHNHWLELVLQGTKSNRNGIGARIKVTAGGLAQFWDVSTASGYASSSAGPVHFGLGAAKTADEIEIRWPSGTVQVLKNVEADRIVPVVEPK